MGIDIDKKKHDWRKEIQPVSITRIDTTYYPNDGQVVLRFYNKRGKEVFNMMLPLQPTVGTPKWKEYHSDK